MLPWAAYDWRFRAAKSSIAVTARGSGTKGGLPTFAPSWPNGSDAQEAARWRCRWAPAARPKKRTSVRVSATANAYLQQVRIAPASEFRELTLTPTDPVAWEVGYSDPAAFRKTFQKLTAVTPSAYRQRFGTA